MTESADNPEGASPDAETSPAAEPSLWRWGRSAWLLRYPEGAPALLPARLRDSPPPGLAEAVTAFSTLLLEFHGEAPGAERMKRWLRETSEGSAKPDPDRRIEIPVRYDGEDLESVARAAGMDRAEVVRRHVGSAFRVRCLGFSPGFAYLDGLDPALRLPRRSTPRPRVAPGSVAIGGDHAGVYPVPSPGGWNLLGTTPVRPFDPSAAVEGDRFLFRTGDAVRFVEDPSATPDPFVPPTWTEPESPWMRVLATGAALGIQDPGRPGWRRFGVPPGGWLDPDAARAAHRLLGQSEDLPLVEFAGGGQVFEAVIAMVVAITGADPRGEAVGRRGEVRPVRPWSNTVLAAGERLRFRGASDGVWSCLAIRGGVEAPRVLGAAAHHARAGLGASPKAGQGFRGQSDPFPPGLAGAGRWIDPDRIPGRRERTVRVWPGPQAGAFGAEAVRRFLRGPWTVDPRSDRVGYRLAGPGIPVPSGNLESEPVLPGSIQVPPDGRPIVTLPEGPTLGGYPKIGWVDPSDLWRVVQTPPGGGIVWQPMGWEGLA